MFEAPIRLESENRILIVNDAPDQLQLMSVIMQQAGYTVATAFDGLEAFEVAQQAQPKLIISDVCMPRASGIELTRMIRASDNLQTTPILLVSAVRRGKENATKGLVAGADDYVEAPYDPMSLVAKATRLMERRCAAELLKALEREKAEALKALRESEERLLLSQKLEAVGQLAGGIAHDFNNLLTAILGYCQLSLRHLQERDPLRRNIEEIRKAGERAASLTRQLLAFSRKQVMQPLVFDLNSVIGDLEKMLRRLIGEDIELKTRLRPDLGNVKADPGQIEQVILNLVVNSRDAMPSGGKLTIETANCYLDEAYALQHIAVVPGAYIMLAVSDTGVGMEEETRKHIFEPFFTTKEQGKGTGLGLATVYGIVKQSGGNIWVYSEVDKGSTFKIYLPRVDEEAEEYKRSDAVADSPKGTETILLVEDDEMVRRLAREVLQTNGYQVLELDTGELAAMVCREHEGQVHLLLTDVVMPAISGPELANQLQSSYPDMRVLYMSGYTDDAIVRHGVLEPGTNFIEKPFTPEALARKVREVLDKR